MLCVTVRFEVPPGRLAEFLPLMRRQAETSVAAEPGCLRFEVWTDPARPGQIRLHEVYADRAAFDLHLAAGHLAEFTAATAELVTGKTVETWATPEAGA